MADVAAGYEVEDVFGDIGGVGADALEVFGDHAQFTCECRSRCWVSQRERGFVCASKPYVPTRDSVRTSLSRRTNRSCNASCPVFRTGRKPAFHGIEVHLIHPLVFPFHAPRS